MLSRAAHQVNTVLEIDTVMRTLVRSAMELVDASGGMAGLVTDGHIVFTEYHEGEQVRPVDFSFPSGYGAAGHVVRTARPYITNDAANDPVVAPEVQQRFGFDTLVTVPIFRRDGRVLGCFQVHGKRERRAFDEDDVVLVVDDEPDARHYVARVLEECKAHVTAVGSAAEALALIAYASAEDRGRALAAGYQRHLAKPVDPADAVVTLADRAAEIADEVRTMKE